MTMTATSPRTPADLTPKDHPTAAIVEVTPALAERWLGTNRRNRNLRPRIVRAYANDMSNGRWEMTGESVKFDTQGNLIDGQHRLNAVIAAGVAVPLFVVRGLDPAVQDVMDTGTKRLASDALKLDGYRYAVNLAAAARFAMAHNNGELKKLGRVQAAYTTSQIKDFVANEPDLVDALEQAVHLRVDVPVTVQAVAFWLIARVDPDACAVFFSTLANNQTDGVGDARNTLLRRLASARRNNETLTPAVQLGLVLRAWNAWRKHQHITQLPIASRQGTVAIPEPK